MEVLLRWGYQLGVQLIPKSTREARMKENLDIFNFHLTPGEMKTLEQMEGKLDVILATACIAGSNPSWPADMADAHRS